MLDEAFKAKSLAMFVAQLTSSKGLLLQFTRFIMGSLFKAGSDLIDKGPEKSAETVLINAESSYRTSKGTFDVKEFQQ